MGLLDECMKTILSAEDWDSLQEVFAVAVELPLDQRAVYLTEACIGHPELRARVESLLDALNTETRIGAMVEAAALQSVEATLPDLGERLGSYRITSILGKGGMGVVYRAMRDDEEYEKEVAIKVVALGVLSEELRERFRDERQILANLDHPHIGRLLDGGTTGRGLPYVVMEFVNGRPIDRWCDEKGLGRNERVRLVIGVAQAVAYAHQHLVVHSDLKPENIYVTEDGAPKLLDFGIAKALGPQRRSEKDKGQETLDAVGRMTPAYASPEQMRGEAITTATDVYQLGVLLYLLLTGRKPFEVKSAGLAEWKRVICEQAVESPKIDPDLDSIVLHALEKDPARRYAAASDLVDDLERCLAGFPVLAFPTSWSYRARKFVGRHMLPVVAAGLVFLLLLGFSIAMSIQAKRIARERDSAEQVANFLGTVFSAPNPYVANGKNVSARDLLDHGAAGIEHMQASPQVRDRLLMTLAESYGSLSVYDRCHDLYEEALQLRRSMYGESSAQVAEVLGDLTQISIVSEHFADANRYAEEWVPLVQKVYGANSEQAADAFLIKSRVEFIHSDMAASAASLRQSIAIATRLHGEKSANVTHRLNLLGNTLYVGGDFAGAEREFEKELSVEKAGNWQNSPNLAVIIDTEGKLAHDLVLQGRYPEAEAMLRESLPLQMKVDGHKHSFTGNTEVRLGEVLAERGDLAEAEKLEQEALRVHTASLGPESMYAGVDYGALARVMVLQRRYAEAEPLMEHRVSICRKSFGDESVWLARALLDLGTLQLEMGRVEEADGTLTAALAMELKKNGGETPYAAQDHLAMGRLRLAEDNLPAAKAELDRSLAIDESVRVDPVNLAATLQSMGVLEQRAGHKQEARSLLERAFTQESSLLAPTDPELVETRHLRERAGS